MTDHSKEQTNFGARTVNKDEKAGLVRQVFSSISGNYDLMNNAMSFGLHHQWKNKLVAMMGDKNGSLLDVAGGTGDIATIYYHQATRKNYTPSVSVIDINQEMLTCGRDKMINNNLHALQWYVGNAEQLPFPDYSFDYYTIGFGLRNVTDKEQALKEAYRVLKPGGKFLCLEFSTVTDDLLAKLYDFYSFKLIPKIGSCLAGNQDAYQYLVESIRNFPAQHELCQMIKTAGFSQVNYKNLNAGIVAIHYGYRI